MKFQINVSKIIQVIIVGFLIGLKAFNIIFLTGIVMKNKSFAFKLAGKNRSSSESKKTQWKAREGLAVAGCTDAGPFIGNYRAYDSWGNRDSGIYC